MKCALVTGAAGFLGRYVSRELDRRGWSVVGIGNQPIQSFIAADWGIARWSDGPVTQERLESLGVSPQVIVHCAGSGTVSESVQDPLRAFERGVGTTIQVLEFARRCNQVPNFIFPSSAAVYGNQPLDGTSHIGIPPTEPISLYGVYKLLAEEAIRGHARMLGMPATIVRFYSLYGPGLHKQLPWDACHKMVHSDAQFFGTGDEERDFLHVTDAAAMLALANEFASRDVPCFEGGTGTCTTVRCVVEMLRGVVNPICKLKWDGVTRAGDPWKMFTHASYGLQIPGFVAAIDVQSGMQQYARWFLEQAR